MTETALARDLIVGLVDLARGLPAEPEDDLLAFVQGWLVRHGSLVEVDSKTECHGECRCSHQATEGFAPSRRCLTVPRPVEGWLHGTIKFYHRERNFGFIVPVDGSPDVFVHASATRSVPADRLVAHQRVEFTLEPLPPGRRVRDLKLWEGA